MILNLNLGDISAMHERVKAIADAMLSQSAEDLAAMTYSKVVEIAQSKLRTSRQEYLNALSYEAAGGGAWTVTLDKKAMWIEEGMPRHEMIDDLLKNAMTSKKGTRYKVIPFPIKGAANTAPNALPIRLAAMNALKRANINMKQIEKEIDGRPKVGALHKLDVMDKPIKTSEGTYQGWGAIGQVRQGQTGTPFLQGMRVMQRQIGGASPMIQKTAMTFRVVSSSQKGSGKWVHPGVPAKKLMDEAYTWAEREWDQTIKPEILALIQQASTGHR
jgi:hypothetical protein